MYVLLLAAALTTQPRKKERKKERKKGVCRNIWDTGFAFDKLLKKDSFKL